MTEPVLTLLWENLEMVWVPTYSQQELWEQLFGPVKEADHVDL